MREMCLRRRKFRRRRCRRRRRRRPRPSPGLRRPLRRRHLGTLWARRRRRRARRRRAALCRRRVTWERCLRTRRRWRQRRCRWRRWRRRWRRRRCRRPRPSPRLRRPRCLVEHVVVLLPSRHPPSVQRWRPALKRHRRVRRHPFRKRTERATDTSSNAPRGALELEPASVRPSVLASRLLNCAYPSDPTERKRLSWSTNHRR